TRATSNSSNSWAERTAGAPNDKVSTMEHRAETKFATVFPAQCPAGAARGSYFKRAWPNGPVVVNSPACAAVPRPNLGRRPPASAISNQLAHAKRHFGPQTTLTR